MVYAFVFITVLVAVVALAYSGVNSTDSVPEKCFSQGLTCIDKHSIFGAEIRLALRNSLPGDVAIDAPEAGSGNPCPES